MSAEPVPPDASPWPDHLLSLAEWDALPEDTSRHYELAEGVMFVTPRPVPRHQLAAGKLWRQLMDQLPAELCPLMDVEVTLEAGTEATVRAPDIAVLPTPVAEADVARFQASDVLLAVEIISPGSRRTDRILKLSEYADAGIEHYWIVDLDDPTSLEAYRLKDGRYFEEAAGANRVALGHPVPLTIDLTSLTTRR